MRRLAPTVLALALLAACEPVPVGLATGGGVAPEWIDFYDTVVFGYDSPEATEPAAILRRWRTGATIVVELTGAGAGDRAEVDRVLGELESLTGLTFRYGSEGQLEVYILPKSEWADAGFAVDTSQYSGFCWIYHADGRIQFAQAVIDDALTGDGRTATLREEITQALGLRFDGYGFPNSTFYEPWNTPTTFADVDEFIIRSHYDDRVLPGMTRAEVHDTLGWN